MDEYEDSVMEAVNEDVYEAESVVAVLVEDLVLDERLLQLRLVLVEELEVAVGSVEVRVELNMVKETVEML